MNKLLPFIFIAITTAGFANDVDSSFGEIYLTEETEKTKNHMFLKSTAEIDNSIEKVYGIEATYQRNFNQYWSVGLSYSRLSSEKKEMVLELQDSTLYPAKPRNSLFFKTRFAPLYGHVNFMKLDSLPFEIGVSAGYGLVTYEGDRKAVKENGRGYTVSIDGSFQVTEKYSFIVELERLNRTQRTNFDTAVVNAKLGLGYRW